MDWSTWSADLRCYAFFREVLGDDVLIPKSRKDRRVQSLHVLIRPTAVISIPLTTTSFFSFV